MISLAVFRRARADAALRAAVERPLDIAMHPAALAQREQAELVDSLLSQLHAKSRELDRQSRYIGKLESILSDGEHDAQFDRLLNAPVPAVSNISPGDLAQLRAVFTSNGLAFPEPPPGLAAMQELLWMMHWVVDHVFREDKHGRGEGG